MTPQEFATRAVGLPWRRWQSSWQCMDCYGCIILYHHEVLGVDLGAVPQSDIASGFSSAQGWRECGTEDGASCFMAWRNGAPTHCGVLLPGAMVLHSEGSDEHPGSVRITRLAAMQRAYGDIRFYRYSPC
ncbi:MAG: hypothetical protein Q7T78_16970 [Rhodoferax sp.]|nr:hypothetical protein [Rhodoferax sp.]